MPATDFDALRFEVQADVADPRDRLYECSPTDPPQEIPLDTFKQFAGPVQDQGREPSCTGMALAGVANYMMRRHWDSDAEPVSSRMMYEMARKHDHLSDDQEGSNPRGAIKGWNKHGVCAESLWPYEACTKHGRLTFARVVDAARRLTRSYLRIDSTDITAMQWGIAEYGVLFANSILHEGWREPDAEHVIAYHPGEEVRGGHAFVIVGYDDRGFWIQNSWGSEWGRDGCALLTYEDWTENGLDVWAAEVDVATLEWGEQLASGATIGDDSKQALFQEMWPHVVMIGDDGRPARHGAFGAAAEDVLALVEHFEDVTQYWSTRRIALVVGAGITPAADAVREAASLRADLLDRQIYPVFLLWKSDWLTPLAALLEREAGGSEAGGDEAVEMRAARSMVKDAAVEVATRAEAAVESPDGAARLLIDHVLEAFVRHPFEIHLVAHGAGDVLLSGMAAALAAEGAACGAAIDSCTLWAPATQVRRFRTTYSPLLEARTIKDMAIFALDDAHERADSVGPYERSVLYLVERGLTAGGGKVLGMERTLRRDKRLRKLRKTGAFEVVIAPTDDHADPLHRSHATTHAGFAQDPATVAATINRIVASGEEAAMASRDPLVRARATARSEGKRREQRIERETMEHCEECRALRERAGVG